MRIGKMLALAAMVVLSVASVAGKSKFSYEIMGAGSGLEGTCLVKVYVYGNASDAELKKAAVHGVIFRGYSGTMSGASQPPMASPQVEETHREFFEAFMDEKGGCQNYASIVPGSYDRVKTAKGRKTGAVVQVMRTSLRQDLEKQGVINSLSSGF